MRKKIQILVCIFILMLFLVGCGTTNLASKEYDFDKAVLSYGNGNIKTVEIQSWDYSRENHIQIVAKDGTIYLVDSTNCTFIKESETQN